MVDKSWHTKTQVVWPDEHVAIMIMRLEEFILTEDLRIVEEVVEELKDLKKYLKTERLNKTVDKWGYS